MKNYITDIMGQNSSLPKPVRKKSLRSTFPRRSSNHNCSLSHTFAVTDNEQKIEQLNINTATEEELMTLPGVNREIAHSIVEHRKVIGRFKKVEDLALVRGIGADKLEQIRPEICVMKRRNFSCPSSCSQSMDSLKSVDSRITIKSNKLLDVNKASVFELQGVHGITQEVAAGIVYYRKKKGPFKQIEDLIKIKCIDRLRLDYLRRFLTINNHNDEILENSDQQTNIITNGINTPPNHKKVNGLPPKSHIPNGLSTSSIIDIFELLSAYSPRPILEEKFSYERNGEGAIRIASWNLHDFSIEKASNLGVKEVICRTILENGWSVIAVQEIVDVAALRVICDELNHPKLRRVIEWKENSRDWNFCMLDSCDSQLGFIYDLTSGGLEIEIAALRQSPKENDHEYSIVIGSFKICDLDIHLVNTNLTQKNQLKYIDHKLQDLISEDDIILLLGDFSKVTLNFGINSKTSEKIFKYLTMNVLDDFSNIQPILPLTTNTSSINAKLGNEHRYLDNILASNKVQGQLTGIWGVVREGLTHLSIPSGWSWGGTVSPHCPVWLELFVTPNVGTAL